VQNREFFAGIFTEKLTRTAADSGGGIGFCRGHRRLSGQTPRTFENR